MILEKYRKKSKKAIKKRDVKVVDKVNDNLFIGLDWFQCTFYAMRKSYFEKRDVINMFSTLLRINESDIVYSEKRFYNYKFCLEYKGINLFFGDERGMFCYKDHHTYKITDKPYLIDSSFQNEYRQSEGFSIICIYARNHIDD